MRRGLPRRYSRTYRVIIIYVPFEALARDTTCDSVRLHHLSLFRSHEILRLRYASEHLVLRFSREGAVIFVDKSSDVISRRQQISRRLNVSQEGGRYLYVRRYIYSASGIFARKVIPFAVSLDKTHVIDSSHYRKEGNMQTSIKGDTCIAIF